MCIGGSTDYRVGLLQCENIPLHSNSSHSACPILVFLLVLQAKLLSFICSCVTLRGQWSNKRDANYEFHYWSVHPDIFITKHDCRHKDRWSRFTRTRLHWNRKYSGKSGVGNPTYFSKYPAISHKTVQVCFIGHRARSNPICSLFCYGFSQWQERSHILHSHVFLSCPVWHVCPLHSRTVEEQRQNGRLLPAIEAQGAYFM